MAFTPCCKNFQITIDPSDCLGIASNVNDISWSQYVNSVDAFSAGSFNAAGASGSYSCNGLSPGSAPQWAVASIGMETYFCNNTGSNITLRVTNTFDYTIHTNAPQFDEAHVQMSIGVDGVFNYAFQHSLFNFVIGAQNDSGVGLSEVFDIVVPSCSTSHIQFLMEGFSAGSGSSYNLSNGTFSIVKL